MKKTRRRCIKYRKNRIFITFFCLLFFSIGSWYWVVHYSVNNFEPTVESANVLKKLFRHKHKQWKRKKIELAEEFKVLNKKTNIFDAFNTSLKKDSQNPIAKVEAQKSDNQITSPNYDVTPPNYDVTYILFWYIPYNDITVPLEFIFKTSKIEMKGQVATVSDCPGVKFVFDRSYEVQSRYIVFHAPQFDSYDLPSRRRQEQYYVWWSAESTASLSPHNYPSNFFNLTASYKRSSDIFVPYATFSWILKLTMNNNKLGTKYLMQQSKLKEMYVSDKYDLEYAMKEIPKTSVATHHNLQHDTKIHKNLRRLISRKKGLVSWLVSNCGNTRSTSLRFQYAGSLSYAGLEIDQFGACNDEQFPIIDKWDPAVFQVLSRYKFYLSFENSFHCRDYLTEKIWMNALYSGAVPVIFGPHGDDVRSLLPPKSYIFAESFESPARLVEFLRYLDKNATAYSEYLQWRTWGKYLGRDPSDLPRPIRGYFGDSPAGFCSLASVTSGKVVGDVEEAWLGRERKECLDVDDAYDILFPL